MSYTDKKSMVLSELNTALSRVDPEAVERLKEEILAAGQVFFVGVGRVLLALQCVCKRLSHLGISAHWVGEVTEPAIGKEDLLIVGSGSGVTLFPLAIARKAQTLGAKVVHIGSNPGSPMREAASFQVRIPVRTKMALEDEVDSAQPMTSLFEQSVLLLGDILAAMIIEEKRIDVASLWTYHANLE
ncbi:MAG: sugar isomerase [Oscillospiraceae bacterium]|jgi:6-phospho-3-hexuloisomerase|nr:sugar isomerase [Oscillospiraceae bacterium]